MLKAIGTVLFLPVLIIITLISPFTINKHWVQTDKNLNRYESYWKTWRNNVKEIWTEDIF